MGVFDTSSFEAEGIEAALDSLVQKGADCCDVHNSFILGLKLLLAMGSVKLGN